MLLFALVSRFTVLRVMAMWAVHLGLALRGQWV